MKTSPAIDAMIPAARPPVFNRFFRSCLVLGLLLTLGVARVQAQDDDYMAIYTTIEQADSLNAAGKTVQAHGKYVEARKAMATFQQNYPTWNTSTVSFRVKYLDQKIAATLAAPAPVATPMTTSASATTAAADAAPAVTTVSSPVKLIDAGNQPRKVMSLHLTAGDKQNVTISTKMSMTMNMSATGAPQMPPMTLPTTIMTMNVAIKDVASDGTATFDTTFGDVDIQADPNGQPGIAEAMKTAMAGMSGVTGTGKITSQGITKDVQFTPPPNAAPQLSQAMEQAKGSFSGATVTWPTEAVGPGAKWESTTQIKSQGMTINQTIDYQLVSVDGDTAVLQGTVKQSAANQTIESPSMPGMKVQLTKYVGTGNGTSTVSLAHVMPQKASMDNDSEISMSMGQQGSMDMKMKINMAIDSK